MCGICGEVDLAGAPDADGVRRAARAIAHRGPDAEGFFFDGPAVLGHRRLSILDLESGDQPMVRDGVALAFNGEAYDFATLRDELRSKGHPFTSRSDTEVVLRAYLEWGDDFPERVHGMFSLAQAGPCPRPAGQEAALLLRPRVARRLRLGAQGAPCPWRRPTRAGSGSPRPVSRVRVRSCPRHHPA